jgi:hypothetical protein
MKYIIACFFILTCNVNIALSQTFQSYSVDIPDPSSFYSSQTQSNWCWAACNQMVLLAKGITETQENQVEKLFGQLINHGAGTDYQLAKKALGGTYLNNGNEVTITPYVSYLYEHNSDDAIVIINHLNNGIPVIMATTQHGRVCVGVDYISDGQSYQITKLRLLDPNPNSNGIEEFTMQYFVNIGLIGFMTYDLSN